MNDGAEIINVQWDFNYNGHEFRAAPSEWFTSDKKNGVLLDVQHEFRSNGRYTVACKVQDDQGGEGMETVVVQVGQQS